MTGKGSRRRREALFTAAVLALAAAVTAAVLLLQGKGSEEPPAEKDGIQVFLDGTLWTGDAAEPQGESDLRVYITVNGDTVLVLPFDEAHNVRILQPDGGENTVTMTGNAVSMLEANCDGQDCVEMGEITRENLEARVMGGFIICLPHRLSVEVRSNE